MPDTSTTVLISAVHEAAQQLSGTEAARRARYRYSCFEHFGEDPQAYGYAASFDFSQSCEDEVVNQLIELQHHTVEYAKRDGRIAEDEFFYAEQNARLAKNAEEYYRSMFGSRVSSWNLRDRHMAETLTALVNHLDRQGGRTKVVVWEHNSHIGDARATQMGKEGEASDWDAPTERKRVRPALPGSYEALFHETAIASFMLNLRNDGKVIEGLRGPRLERAIGVIYLPRTERISHYFHARLPEQFDAVIHFDQTRAVEPLDRTSEWERGELPETYPSTL